MNPSHGTRPGTLKDDDFVTVKLRNGSIAGPWRVVSRQGPIRWSHTKPDTPYAAFDIVEWELAK